MPDNIRVVPGPDDIEVVASDDPEELAEAQAGAELYHAPYIRPVGRQPSALRRQLVAGDIVALLLTWGSEVAFGSEGGVARRAVCGAAAFMVTIATMRQTGLYRSRVCALRSLEAIRVFTACVLGAATFAVCLALVGFVDLAGPAIVSGVGTVLVLGFRWRFTRWLKARRSTSRFLRPVIIVGTNEDAYGLWTLLREEPELGFLVSGVVGPVAAGSSWEGLPNRPDVDKIAELAKDAGANGVIVVASAFDVSARSKAVELGLAAGLHVQVWPGIHDLSSRRMHMAPVSGVPLLYVEAPKARTVQLAVKRGMDLAIGSMMALTSAPVLAVAALAIKLDDGGPVIYRSKRVGLGGAPIEVLKLRTMVPNAAQLMTDVAALNERKGGPLFKVTDDPRVTRVGQVLRATSIDELPQLWNVLTGTMSLVGPRPALLHEVQHFDEQLHRRHQMRPGMTGLWQVEARDNPSFSAYRRLDLSYIDDWSLALDLAIFASTTHEIVVRAGKALFKLVFHRDAAPAAVAKPVVVPANVADLADMSAPGTT